METNLGVQLTEFSLAHMLEIFTFMMVEPPHQLDLSVVLFHSILEYGSVLYCRHNPC